MNEIMLYLGLRLLSPQLYFRNLIYKDNQKKLFTRNLAYIKCNSFAFSAMSSCWNDLGIYMVGLGNRVDFPREVS